MTTDLSDPEATSDHLFALDSVTAAADPEAATVAESLDFPGIGGVGGRMIGVDAGLEGIDPAGLATEGLAAEPPVAVDPGTTTGAGEAGGALLPGFGLPLLP